MTHLVTTPGVEARTRRRVATAVESGAAHVVRFVGSRTAIISVLALFVMSGTLIALTMSRSIYDEHWHMGIIEQYAHQFSPRLRNGISTTGLGDVEYTGSFLFHWLMSFPYRISAALFGQGFVTLVVMRLIGVALVTAGLVIWRRVLLQIVPSTAIANTVIAVMASLPLLSFVGATVNYDNLLFPLTAACFLFLIRIVANGGTRVLDWAWMLVFGFASTITKFSFAPVFALLVVYLLIRYLPALVRTIRAGGAFSAWKRFILPGALLVLVVSAVISRYVVNLFRFGSPDPSCDTVAPHEYCMSYGVYARNEGFADKSEPGQGSLTGAVAVFFGQWLRSMTSTLTWVGIRDENGIVRDTFGGEITRPLLYITVIVILAIALLLGRVIPERFRVPFWIALGVHTIALFTLNYQNLVQYGLLYAYSARYFFPFLPALIFLAAAGLARTLPKISASPKTVAVIVLAIAVLFMTQGGGPLAYLNGLDEGWLHPETPLRNLTLLLGRAADRLFVIG